VCNRAWVSRFCTGSGLLTENDQSIHVASDTKQIEAATTRARQMATNQLRRVIQTLRQATLPPEEAGLTDRQLLQSYVNSLEEAAYAALVRRHGPMV
jgi:hypothetical protein